MKKSILWLMLIALPAIAFSQQASSLKISRDHEYYLQRSKNQKTVAWILLGGGAALITTGYFANFPSGNGFDDLATKGALVAGGGLLTIASIPVFIASGKNKRRAKAAKTSIKIHSLPALPGYGKPKTLFPVVSVKVRL